MSLFFEEDRHDMYDYFPGQYVFGDDVYIPEEYQDEKWWYIDEMPSYMISNYGRVWSAKSQCFIKPKKMDREGHLGVCLHHNGKPYYLYLHRLMAKAFMPNPRKCPIVRHLNDITDDNDLDNLAWGTQLENMHDSIRNGRFYYFSDEDREKSMNLLRRPILAINIKSGERIEFRGQNEASRILGLQQANIWKVLNGQRRHTEGWYFEYLKRRDDNG